MTAEARSAWEVAAAVPDPELPMLTIGDLGMLRGVTEDDEGRVRVRVTPTYSGCPATEMIQADIRAGLAAAGYREVEVEIALSPAWTTDDITEQGRDKLAAAGIAPPACAPDRPPTCPRCGGLSTRELSRFGATTCTALWVCGECQEPFEQFRVLR